jgi:hypothetical protein
LQGVAGGSVFKLPSVIGDPALRMACRRKHVDATGEEIFPPEENLVEIIS